MLKKRKKAQYIKFPLQTKRLLKTSAPRSNPTLLSCRFVITLKPNTLLYADFLVRNCKSVLHVRCVKRIVKRHGDCVYNNDFISRHME